MNAELKNLYDKKGQTWAQMQDVARKLKEGKDLTPEETKQFDAWDQELKSVTDKIAMIQRAEQLEAQMNAGKLEGQPGNGSTQAPVKEFKPYERKMIFTRGFSKGVETLSAEEKAAYATMQRENEVFTKLMAGGSMTDEERVILSSMRAQSTTGTAGGYSIPTGFIAKIDSKLKYISPFFAEMQAGINADAETIFDVLKTETGNDLPFPTDDDTANTGELLAENGDAFAATTDLTLGQITLKAYKYSSKPMKASNELLNDTGINLEDRLVAALATRIARIANTHLTTGDNAAKPQGIVTGATAGKTTASGAAITFPEVLDLIHSVDPSYRMSPSARLMFHDNILLYLKKLTIGSSTNDARPIWQPGFAVGAPDTVDGFRYLINQDMASSVAVNNITMLFGDMRKYMVRLVSNYAIRRLNERFADFDQTAWLLFARLDGRYANTAAIKKLTQAAA